MISYGAGFVVAQLVARARLAVAPVVSNFRRFMFAERMVARSPSLNPGNNRPASLSGFLRIFLLPTCRTPLDKLLKTLTKFSNARPEIVQPLPPDEHERA